MRAVPLLAVVVILACLWAGGVELTTWIAPGTMPGARSWTDLWPLVLAGLGLVFALVGSLGGRRAEPKPDGATRLGLLAAAAIVWALTVTRIAGLAPVPMAVSFGLGPAAAPGFLALGALLGLFVLGVGPALGLLPRERPLVALVVLVAGNGKLMSEHPDQGLALVSLMALVAAVLLAAERSPAELVRRITTRIGRPHLLLILALLGWWLVAAAGAANSESSWRMTWRLVCMALACLVCLGAIADERAGLLARRVLDGLVLGLAVTLALGFLGVLEATALFPMGDVLASRLRILGGNPNLMGAYLALGLPLTLGWLLAGRGSVSLGRRLFGSLLVAALVTGLYLTRSRSAQLAGVVGAGLFLVSFGLPAARSLLGRLGTRAVAGGFGLAALAVVLLVSPVGDGLRASLDAKASSQSAVGQRWHFWRMASDAALDHPLVGLGPANFAGHAQYAQPSYYDGTVQTWHTHNIFLAALEGAGFPGLILFCLWLVAFLGLLTRVAGSGAAEPGPAIGMWAAALALLVANQLDLGQSQLTFVPHVFWLFLLAVGLSVPAGAEPVPESGSPSRAKLALPLAAALLAWPAAAAMLVGLSLSDLARSAATRDDHPRAIELAELALSPALVTDRYMLLGNVGKWHKILGDHESSIATLREAAEVHPLSSTGWQRLALAELLVGRHRPALESSERALAMDPRGVGAPEARITLAWATLGVGDVERAGQILLEALAGGAKIPRNMPLREVQAADGRKDVLLLATGGGTASLLELLQGLGEGLVARSAVDEVATRRAIPGLVEGFRHLDRPLEAADYIGRMTAAMDDPIRSIYYAWIELLVEGKAVDQARDVLAASPFHDEPFMRDLFPSEGQAEITELQAFGADLFYTHGRIGDLFLQKALLEVRAGDRAAGERTLAQAMYVSSDPIARASLSHRFMGQARGSLEDERRDLERYLAAASINLANLDHPRRTGDAARAVLRQTGGDVARARDLIDELTADLGPTGAAMHAALERVIAQR